jgi:RNA polymerase sigma-70 factor, ECF subfamily
MTISDPFSDPLLYEQQLVLQATQGQLAAFNQLVLNYQSVAYGVAYRMVQEQDAAADAVQESFLKAYRGLAGFQGGNFKSWLLRIVTNTCYDYLRAHKRHQTDSLDELPVDAEYATQLVDGAESPQQYVERRELNEVIELAIRTLPADQRLVLTLCDVQGYAYEEIVEITGFPMGTVKSRIARARAKVRDFLLQRPELLPATFRPTGGDY